MELAEIALVNSSTRADVLRLAGAVERLRAPDCPGDRQCRPRRGRRAPAVERFRNEPGAGVTGVVDGHEVAVGRHDGRIEVSWDGLARANLGVHDTVKPMSAAAIAELRTSA